jgi:hypothetical protein
MNFYVCFICNFVYDNSFSLYLSTMKEPGDDLNVSRNM